MPTAPTQEEQDVKNAPAADSRGIGSTSLRVRTQDSSTSLLSQRLARTLDQALNTMGSAWDRVREVRRKERPSPEQVQGPLKGAGDSRSVADGEVPATAGAVAAISTLAGQVMLPGMCESVICHRLHAQSRERSMTLDN